jgi:hypothetical protein
MAGKPLFNKGDVVRYASGPTALMAIETIRAPHGNARARYWGTHCLGGVTGANHDKCTPADATDMRAWVKHAKWRK